MSSPGFNVPWPHDGWSEIIPGLHQGGIYTITSDVVIDREFDLVVSLHSSYGFGPHEDVEHIRLLLPDDTLLEGEKRQVREVAKRIVSALKDNKRVLVRCAAGYNRSGLVVASVLMAMGKTADETIELIRERRSKFALCNPIFVKYIQNGEV
jgi:protein-tyrosine phosphatase